MPSGKVPVYCHMSRHGLGACGGGGWTLVMKTNGIKVSRDNQPFVFMWECGHQSLYKKKVTDMFFVSLGAVRDTWIAQFNILTIRSPEI